MFLPGGAKYLDLPGLLALNAPGALWLAGEETAPAITAEAYKASGQAKQLAVFSGDAAQKTASAAAWLVE
jgi:hypothetical protein